MPRVGVAVCSRPDFEEATYEGSLALQHAVDHWRNLGLELVDLRGDDAVRSKVLDALARSDPILFFCCGHGNENLLTGQQYNEIFWTCNCKELRERIVVALSCYTAADLGSDAVQNKGCRCYLGYSEVFGWITTTTQDPMLDVYAVSFFDPVLELLYRLMDGASTADAYRASIDKWNYWIDYWSRSEDPNAPLVLQWLLSDRDCQKLIGDPAATITVGIPVEWWIAEAIGAAVPLIVTAAMIVRQEVEKAGILV